MNPQANSPTLQEQREALTPHGDSFLREESEDSGEELPREHQQDPDDWDNDWANDGPHQEANQAHSPHNKEAIVSVAPQRRGDRRGDRGDRAEQPWDFRLPQFPVNDNQQIEKKLFQPIYSLAASKIEKLLSKEQGKIQLNYSSFSIQVSCASELILKRVSEAIDSIVSTFNCCLIVGDEVELKKLYRSQFLREQLQGAGMILYFVFEQRRNKMYIGGSVEEHLLRMKVSKMKRLVIDECTLSQYPSTRSYETLIRQVFKLPGLLTILKDSYQLETIEIVKKDREEHPRDLRCRFICNPTPNLAINKLPIFISQNIDKCVISPALVFRSTIPKDKSPSFPPISNVFLLIINETKLGISYLYVVATRKGLQEGMEQVIDQIGKLEQKFIGVRYFKGLHPQKPPTREDQIETVFPSVLPYSWTVIMKEFAELDWRQFLKQCAN